MAREGASGWTHLISPEAGLGDPTHISTKGLGDAREAEIGVRAAVQTWFGGAVG